MGGNPDSDEYEEDEADDEISGDDDLDLDRAIKDMEIAKRRSVKVGEPAWRRLEQRLEQKRTAELISDFEDYDIGLGDESPRTGFGSGKARTRSTMQLPRGGLKGTLDGRSLAADRSAGEPAGVLLHPAQHSDDDALDQQRLLLEIDPQRLEIGVLRQQPDGAALLLVALDRDLILETSHHDLALTHLAGAMNGHQIAIEDAGVLHAHADDLEQVMRSG